jgi:hypothetical protein
MRLTISSGTRRLLLIGALAACGGDASEDGLAIEVIDDTSLRATASVGDEEIAIEARIVRTPATTPEGESYEDESVLASIVGQDGTVYADLRHSPARSPGWTWTGKRAAPSAPGRGTR